MASTSDLITTEDVKRHLGALSLVLSKDGIGIQAIAEHLAGNLSMVAQTQADKRLEAAEELKGKAQAFLDAVRVFLNDIDEWYKQEGYWRGPPPRSSSFHALQDTIRRYEELAP